VVWGAMAGGMDACRGRIVFQSARRRGGGSPFASAARGFHHDGKTDIADANKDRGYGADPWAAATGV